MNALSYPRFAAAGLLLLLHVGVAPAAPRAALRSNDTPAEIQRKAARERAVAARKAILVNSTNVRTTHRSAARLNRTVRVLLGLEASRKVTPPVKRDWQLHRHQQQLKRQAGYASQARKRRCTRALN